MAIDEARKLAEEVLGESGQTSLVKGLFFGRFSNKRLPAVPQVNPLPLLEKLHSIGIDPVQIDRERNIPDHVIKKLRASWVCLVSPFQRLMVGAAQRKALTAV